MGWRRAFCTTIPRDPEESPWKQQQQSPSPRIRTKFGFLSASQSNPSTPRLSSQSLRCRAPPPDHESPRLLHCKTTTTCGSIKSPRLFSSAPSSPRSPARFSLFKSGLARFSKSNCGVCVQRVRTGQGMAIFTAECSHSFHFPCIAAYLRKRGGALVCPVCSHTWREDPLLTLHNTTTTTTTTNSNNVLISPPDPKSNNPKKLYNDDEPLLSPTSAARFDSIPEVDEDNETEEFQGFFADPSTPTSRKIDGGGPKAVSRTVDVKMLPVAAVVSAGRAYETYAVVLRVKAPPPPPLPLLDPSRRAPIDLVAVLDAGGTMTGAKLQMLKRAMRLVVSSLSAADRLSIISFSAAPRRLMPLRRMTPQGQRSARLVIDRLACGSGSSAAEALKKATKVLEDRRQRNPVATVMLLSDGQDAAADRRETPRKKTVTATSTRFSHLEIPVHEHGFSGGGAEPAEDAFAKCVGSLLSVVAQDLRLQIGFSSGSAEVMAVYSCTGRPSALGPGSVRLGDLYSEEERELLVELKVPVVPVGAQHVMSMRCCYKDPVSQEVVYGKEQALLVPRPHAVRSNDPKIERLRNFFITTRAVAEARRLVDHGDLGSAHQLLGSARALIVQTQSDEDLEVLDGELKGLRQRQMAEIQRRRTSERADHHYHVVDENGEPLTPTSAWRAAEQLAKVAIMRKSMNRVSDLHGFENARF